MVSKLLCSSITQGYLLLVILNILIAVKIEKLIVPDVVQNGVTDVILDCIFSSVDDRFKLQWWFARDKADRSSLVYEWTPLVPPKVTGALTGRLNLSSGVFKNHRAIRLLRVGPELSGEYTCVVNDNGVQVREAQRMLVFSPEEEFEVIVKQNNPHIADITCLAHGVYPRPELILEYDKSPIIQQVQRVWHMNNILRYNAETKADLPIPHCGNNLEVTCRLHLPHAVYTAIKKKVITFWHPCSLGGKSGPVKYFYVLIIVAYFCTNFCKNLMCL